MSVKDWLPTADRVRWDGTGNGNGAREALTEIETLDHPGSICWADWLLLELAARGFKVVPMTILLCILLLAPSIASARTCYILRPTDYDCKNARHVLMLPTIAGRHIHNDRSRTQIRRSPAVPLPRRDPRR